MKKKNTISGLFQENQHKLNEKPSPQTWRRLERRLDDRRRYSKVSFFRQITSIAALLAIGGLVALMALVVEPWNTKRVLAANDYSPEKLEDLNDNNSGAKIVEFIRQYSDRLAQPIAEGDFTKRITLSGRVEKVTNSQFRVSMNDFKWLEGTWKQEVNGRKAHEIWKKNGQVLEGQGFLLDAKSEQAFVDPMKIYISRGKLYFETRLAQDQQPVRFALKRYFADRMVFENEEQDFPKQIILEIQSPKVYSITFQNEAYLDLSNAEADYLAKRGTLVPQRIVRVLERVE